MGGAKARKARAIVRTFHVTFLYFLFKNLKIMIFVVTFVFKFVSTARREVCYRFSSDSISEFKLHAVKEL